MVIGCLVLAAVSATQAGCFSVEERAGTLAIRRDGQEFVRAISVEAGKPVNVRHSYVTLADGARVWNRWCEEPKASYRLEVAQRADGAVEITFAGQVPFDAQAKERCVRLEVPRAVLADKAFASVKASGGRYWHEERGAFDEAFKALESRWLATEGLTFDFNPLGPGDDYAFGRGTGWRYMDSYSGIWDVKRLPSGDFAIETGAEVKTTWGGYFGTKLVLRMGSFEDYDTLHPLRVFSYALDFEPLRLVAFGSPKRGAAYTEGDVLHSYTRGYGWTEDDPWERNPVVGYKEGVYYSALTGNRPATYRFSGLPDGFYLFTLAAGNYKGVANQFDVVVNGEPLFTAAEIPAKRVRRITKALYVTGGKIEVSFSGTWLLSAMGVQALLSDAEDFNFLRKPWMTDGYEPGLLQRNCDVPGPVRLAMRDETADLPVPGTEFATPRKDLVREIELPDPLAPELSWTHDTRIYRLFNNSSLMHELDAPGALKTYLDRELKGRNVNVIMLSGMLSRHTFLGHRDRGLAAVKRVVDEAHRRGIKVIDHFDATLLWNAGHGFRVLAETLPQVNISSRDNLPAYQYCPMNPDFRKRFLQYVEDDAKNGVDGFQIDEVQFWCHGCACDHCRAAFHRDTGWTMPMNECDDAWQDRNSPFMKRWLEWKAKVATDLLIAARRRAAKYNPHLVFSAYSTPWGYTWPKGELRLGRCYIDLGRTVNFFGMEVMSRCVMKGVRAELPHRRSQNTVMHAYGAPMWDWYYNADWQNDYVAWAISAMTGHSPLLAEVDKDASVPDYPGFSHAMDRRRAKTAVEAALLFSAPSRDWNEGVLMRDDLLGTAQAFEAKHIPYEIIGEISLNAKSLSKYKILFVGSAHCIDDKGIAAIRDYAAAGGLVRLSGLAGACDEIGEKRAVWPFADIFGFEPKSDAEDLRLVERPSGKGRYLYSFAPRGIPFCQPESTSPYPFKFDPDLVAERKFWDEVAAWAAPAMWWRIDAPEQVYTSLWREKDGTLVIHFLNATGVHNVPWENLTSEAPDPAFPALTKDIVFTLPKGLGTAALATSPDFAGEKSLPVILQSDGSLAVTLPKELLKAYTLVRVR